MYYNIIIIYVKIRHIVDKARNVLVQNAPSKLQILSHIQNKSAWFVFRNITPPESCIFLHQLINAPHRDNFVVRSSVCLSGHPFVCPSVCLPFCQSVKLCFCWRHTYSIKTYSLKQKRSTEGCSKFKSSETRQVQERLVSTLEHMQVPKWDRTRCPEE